MKNKNNDPEQVAELRRRAEEVTRKSEALSGENVEALSPEEMRQALHELRVHQIELEMQNEELRRAQAELDASRARYYDLYDLAPVGYVTLSEKGLILEANLTAATLLGVARGVLVRRTLSGFILKEDQDTYYLHLKQLLETDMPQVCEMRFQDRNGKMFWARMESAVTRDADGTAICRTVISDITDRKQSEETLKQQSALLTATNKELESFSYSISHDLRAPLRAIDGYVRMILRQQGDNFDENTKRQFDVIRNNAQKMGRLIDDILAFSRLGRQSLSMSSLNVEELTREVWEEIKTVESAKPINLKIDHILPGMGDRSLIKQVMINLLSNAVKFTRTREVPHIEVGGYDKGSEIEYFIRDNGVGFDMRYQDKLFGVFQRLHGDDEFEGNGIGLALVQLIVNRHGGKVWAEGKIGEGACFHFTLPRAV
jgi:PAS domain S-box-containing protein